MNIPRRISHLSLAALVVLSSSVFLFGDTAAAQSPAPLAKTDQVIEQQKQKVEKKSNQLDLTSQQIQELEQKKQTLAQQLEEANKAVEDLNQKLAEKKAAAEAEAKRVEQLKNMFVRINVYAGNSAGNLYAPGNCTWYAKSKRPDLPNNLGNANTWYYNAQAQGFGVGTAPKKGAVGQAVYGMHVVYVEGVSLDGSMVTISEMNYGGLYRMNTRTVPASEFIYIYEKN